MLDSVERLRDRDKAHVWHPFTAQADWARSEPLIIDRAEGVYLFDSEGNRYLDGVASLWCNVHGHRHPKLDEALLAQLDKVAHSTLLGLTHRPAIDLSTALVEKAPNGLTRVFFSDDGATAVEVALKAAFQYWRQKRDPEPNRDLFLAFADAYHGDTLGDASVGGIARFQALFRPLLFPVLRAPKPHCFRCPLGLERESCEIACLGEVEKLLRENAGRLAAVVIEPIVQMAAGVIVHPEGYLRGLRELTRKYDTLLILDEVAVGFGRTGTLFACERENVAPDFLCLAKGLTGGYLPLAATLTTEEIYSAFFATATEGKTFFHGHTYCGNPLAAAVALASLRVFDDEQTLENLSPKIDRMRKRLNELKKLPNVGDVRQVGLIGGIELMEDKTTKTSYPWERQTGARVCRVARRFGLLIRPLGDVLVVFPPLSIGLDQIDDMFDAIDQGIRIVTEEEDTR